MKRLTVFLIIIALLSSSLLIVNCDKKSSTGPEDLLVGFWNSSTAGLALFLTTNEVQQAVNMLAQGTGDINLTGLINAALSWIIGFGDPTMMAFVVSNQSLLQFLLLPAFPAYNMIVANIPEQVTMAVLNATTVADESSHIGQTADFAYDRTTYTFTATNAQFFDEFGNPSLTANGAITQPTMNVPANTPTNVLPLNLPLPGVAVLELADDGTFTLTIGFGEDEEELTGTWEDLGNNELGLEIALEEGEDPVIVIVDYTVDAQTLTVTYEEDICTVLAGILPGDCIELLELVFGLDQGSLTSGTGRLNLTFTKAAQKGSVSPYLEGWNPTKETLLYHIYGRMLLNAAEMFGM